MESDKKMSIFHAKHLILFNRHLAGFFVLALQKHSPLTKGKGYPVFILTAFFIFFLSGCAGNSRNESSYFSVQPDKPIKGLHALQGISDEIPLNRISNLPRKIAANGIRKLENGDLDGAGKNFNQALKLNPSNANLQLLNALTYHIKGLQGDSTQLDLAHEGYILSIQFDPSNWIAHYQLGLLYMDKREFSLARDRFAESLMHRPENREILYNMVCASYYSQDPKSAAAALSQLKLLEPDSPRTLRASAMVAASLGNPDEANSYYDRYSDLEKDRESVGSLFTRINDWKTFYSSIQKNQANQPIAKNFLKTASSSKRKSNTKSVAPPLQPVNSPIPDMVIVDVVIVRSEEQTKSRKGVNLLEGLSLQFGQTNFKPEKNIAAWTSSYAQGITSITRAITLPALTYSLNIFNSTSARNEVLARPTLVALNGLESKFFSGINIRAAADSGGDSKSKPLLIVDDIGVELKIKPTIIDENRVKIWVSASRTFLRTPSDNVDFQYRIEKSKTNVEANVLMNFGETLILSGLSEKETENIRSGVPGLQDLPFAQYFFSEKNDINFQKSVLILLTPRKPAYVYQDTSSLPKEQRSKVLNELQARFSDWFKPYPNWASVFHHLQSNVLYREFRTGDVTLEHWESQKYLRNRLKSILGFLYF